MLTVSSREYKITLAHRMFLDRKPAAAEFGQELRTCADGIKGIKQEGEFAVAGRREITFLDTLDHTINLNRFVFRQRQDLEENQTEYTLKCWELLSGDPGMQPGDDAANRRADNKAFKAEVVKIEDDLPADQIAKIPHGITPIFSPRSGGGMLDTYASLLDAAKSVGCVTLAFGVSDTFKEQLKDDKPGPEVIFMLLEKKDERNPKSKKEFVQLTAGNNVYQAWGAFIDDPVYRWARETNTRKLQLNTHVAYVHSKFLLKDPLSADPIVVTGSANFSTASTTANDENMIVIRGDRRSADIYFTEFMRIFNHYYFRAMHELDKDRSANAEVTKKNLFLDGTDGWLKRYKLGSLRAKRVAMFARMDGAQEG